ncbi:HesA/MoeB/ThiF family protein [Oceanivirga salmonicida]|uniref:HesA/MoeB/ThiF family protein n=1 Tax=Oceanivirga salmonicida TaxID=1769291 RepID=UPI0012E30EF0|nr:ThiF family adenylyltransferase [Oceanivirga salmonicida]
MKLPKIKEIHSKIFLKDKIRLGIGKDYICMIPNENDKYTSFINLLDGNNTIEDIFNMKTGLTENEIKEGIELLDKFGYLEDAAIKPSELFSENELERYSVNINFFSTLDFKNKYALQEILKKTTVLILGLGGIGSNICLSLAELGIGKIIGVDYDTVELKNLNRQILYNSSNIGKLKIEVAKEFINNFNPDIDFIGLNIQINSVNKIKKIIETYNPEIVINVADYPTGYIDFWVNEACIELNKPYFSALVGKKNGVIYSVIPNKTACYNCQFLEDIKEDPDYIEELKIIRNNKSGSYFRTPNGALGNSCLFQGYFISSEIMRYLFWGEKRILTYNKRFYIDFLSFKQEFTELKINSECRICSGEYINDNIKL